jgi:hypothetical protein
MTSRVVSVEGLQNLAVIEGGHSLVDPTDRHRLSI